LSNLKYTHNLKKLKIYNLKIFKYIKLKKELKKLGASWPPPALMWLCHWSLLNSNEDGFDDVESYTNMCITGLDLVLILYLLH